MAGAGGPQHLTGRTAAADRLDRPRDSVGSASRWGPKRHSMTIDHAAGQRAPLDTPNVRRRRRPPPSGRGEVVRPDRGDIAAAITIGAVVTAWWPMYLAVAAGSPIRLVPLMAHVTGMLAGYGIAVMLVLMSRAPLLEARVGSDTLVRWHARGGRALLTLALVHAWAAIAAWADARQESAASASWHVVSLPGLFAATLGTGLFVAVAVASVRSARRRMSFEAWHLLHLLTYVAAALTFVHQLAGPDLAGHRVVQVAWAMLYAQSFALLVRFRFLAPMRLAQRHRFRVSAVSPATADAVNIEIVGEHLDELGAVAGQFFRWRFLTPDTWLTAHPFSLSAAPTSRSMRITVKALGDGSSHLQSIAPGTWIVAEGPYGAMTAERRTRPNVLLVAGGIGITPMRALLETMPLTSDQRLTLVYRARDIAHVAFPDELDAIARHRGAKVHYVLGDEPGALDARALRRFVGRLDDVDIYLCGPPPMAAAVRRSLLAAGVEDDQIHEERFSW